MHIQTQSHTIITGLLVLSFNASFACVKSQKNAANSQVKIEQSLTDTSTKQASCTTEFKPVAKSIIPHLMQVLAKKRVEAAMGRATIEEIKKRRIEVFRKSQSTLMRLSPVTLDMVAKSSLADHELNKILEHWGDQEKLLAFILAPEVTTGEQTDLSLSLFYRACQEKIEPSKQLFFRERLASLDPSLRERLHELNGETLDGAIHLLLTSKTDKASQTALQKFLA